MKSDNVRRLVLRIISVTAATLGVSALHQLHLLFSCGSGRRHFGAREAGTICHGYGSKIRLPEPYTRRQEARAISFCFVVDSFVGFWRTDNRYPRFRVKLQTTGKNDLKNQDGCGVVTPKRHLHGGFSHDLFTKGHYY